MEHLERHLEPLLGAFTARMAIKTAALRSLNRAPEQLTPADLPALIDGLKPMLNTLVGATHTRVILEQFNAIAGARR